MKDRALRRGFTTGASAAAGAKAAAEALFASLFKGKRAPIKTVSITLPSGRTLDIKVKNVVVNGRSAEAVIIKDAGDDPDVTNRAEIITKVTFVDKGKRGSVKITNGPGVGVVTRPGLKVPVGRPAINPVPLKMIRNAVKEAAQKAGVTPSVVVTVSVPRGGLLAKKTMNPRLGIVGGISILGTTGIVEPMSLSAYRHSITAAMDVAIASGIDTIVLSTGRSSEKAAEGALKLPEVAYVLIGDHMGYALKEASKRAGLKRVVIAGQFGKFSKLGAGHFETHCTEASVDLGFIAGLLRGSGIKGKTAEDIENANTARQVFFMLKDSGLERIFKTVCKKVEENARRITGKGLKINAMLVGYAFDIAYSGNHCKT